MTSALKPDTYKQLKKEIDSRGIKTKFIAEKIGVSPSYLGQVLSGSRKLSDSIALNTINELGLPVEIFLKRS